MTREMSREKEREARRQTQQPVSLKTATQNERKRTSERSWEENLLKTITGRPVCVREFDNHQEFIPACLRKPRRALILAAPRCNEL